MDRQLLDLDKDYLISSFHLATVIGVSTLLEGAISHDKITCFLSKSDFTSADLGQLVKPFVRPIQSEEAVLIIDDSIEEKLYTDESEFICWRWNRPRVATSKASISSPVSTKLKTSAAPWLSNT
jgi:hypothetical protein